MHTAAGARTQLSTDADGTTLRLFDNASHGAGLGGFALTVGTWYKVAVVMNGSSATMYHAADGGTLTSSSAANFTPASPATGLMVGRIQNASSWLNGRMAAFKMWQAALTANEVAAEFTQYAPIRTTNLLRYHSLTTAPGTTNEGGTAGNLTAGSSATTTESGPSVPVIAPVNPLRLYATNVAPSYTPPLAVLGDLKGSWDGAASGAYKLGAKEGTLSIGNTANVSTIANLDYAMYRLITEPMITAGTIDGTLDWLVMVHETNAGLNAFTHAHVWVTQGDSNNLRGTLLSNPIDTTEWTVNTGTTSTGVPSDTSRVLTPVAAQVGDRVIIELGFRSNATAATYSARLNRGGTGTDAVAGVTDNARVGWFQFSNLNHVFTENAVQVSSTFTAETSMASDLEIIDAVQISSTFSSAAVMTSGITQIKALRSTLSIETEHTSYLRRILPAESTLNVEATLSPYLNRVARPSTILGVETGLSPYLSRVHLAWETLTIETSLGNNLIVGPPPPGRAIYTRRQLYVPARHRGLRFIVQDIRTKEFLHWDLPVSSPSISYALNGAKTISGTLQPEHPDFASLNLRPRSVWIHAEQDGLIRGSGILQPSKVNDDSFSIDAAGFTSYLHGIGFQGTYSGIQIDPAVPAKLLWTHAQGFYNGNINVIVDDFSTPVRIGEEERDVSFQTGGDEIVQVKYGSVTEDQWEALLALGLTGNPADQTEALYPTRAQLDSVVGGTPSNMVEFSAGPYKLNWWEETNSGSEWDSLAQETPFDFVEVDYWNEDKTDVLHRLKVGYPRIGRRRDDLRFIQGVNTEVIPLTDNPDMGCTEVTFLGAGEGSSMIRGTFIGPDNGSIRHPVTREDSTITRNERARAYAEDEYMRMQATIGFDQIVVDAHHDYAKLGSWDVGDDIPVWGDISFHGRLSLWHRITNYDYDEETGLATLDLRRSDTYRYGSVNDSG